jgi:hypothetical protein
VAPSSRGLGRRPLKAVTPVRIRSGLPTNCQANGAGTSYVSYRVPGQPGADHFLIFCASSIFGRGRGYPGREDPPWHRVTVSPSVPLGTQKTEASCLYLSVNRLASYQQANVLAHWLREMASGLTAACALDASTFVSHFRCILRGLLVSGCMGAKIDLEIPELGGEVDEFYAQRYPRG